MVQVTRTYIFKWRFHWRCRRGCVKSQKTVTRRTMRPDELSSVVHRSRHTTEDSSSRRITRLNSLCSSLGTLRNHDGNAMKTPLENISSHNLYYFVIISIRSTCSMWPNYSATEQLGTVFLLAQRMQNLPSCVHVLQNTLNLILSRCCFA